MSEFFKPVDFTFPEDPADNSPKIAVIWHREKLASALAEIEEEVVRIKNGTSDLVTYPIDPGAWGFPAMNALKIFVADPFEKDVLGLQAILKQDFSARAGDLFFKLVMEAREEVVK